MNKDDQQAYLIANGWKREDQEIHGFDVELWIPPDGGKSVTRLTAVRQQKRCEPVSPDTTERQM